MQIPINLNDTVKVQLTDWGKEIYYHQFDKLNENIRRHCGNPLEPRMPTVDNEGYTEMQLWVFMQIYGPYTSITAKPFIMPLNLLYEHEEDPEP